MHARLNRDLHRVASRAKARAITTASKADGEFQRYTESEHPHVAAGPFQHSIVQGTCTILPDTMHHECRNEHSTARAAVRAGLRNDPRDDLLWYPERESPPVQAGLMLLVA